MKTIKKISIKNIEIIFQFEDQIITIKAEPYRTLYEIKEKAIKRMICAPNNVVCFHSNIDLSNEENKKVGDIFNHKEKVTLKLKLKDNNSYLTNSKFLYKNLPLNNIKNTINQNNNLNNNLIIPKFKKIDKNLYKKNLLFPNSLRLQNSDNNRLTKNKSDGALEFLPIVTAKSNHKGNNINFCECKKYIISDYCRTCRKFICNDCKTNNEKHKKHLTIRLNMENLENNINLYGNLIQTDIKNLIELNKNVLKNKNEVIDINELEKHKESMNTKYQQVIDNYSNIMKRIKKYLDKENEGKVKLLVSAYNSSSVKIHKEIYDLIENLKAKYNDKNKREIKFNELEYYLNEINNKEGTLAFFKRDIIKYHLANEINDKLKNSFDKINHILDEIINEENPFNLDNKYYPELLKMKIAKTPDEESNDIK